MFDILIIVFAVYFVYQNIRSLTELPLSQWEFVHYALAVLTVVIAGLGVWKAWQVYKKSRLKKEEEAEKREEEEAERQAEDRDEDNELAYLDELDAEEDARKAEKEIEAHKAEEEEGETEKGTAAKDK